MNEENNGKKTINRPGVYKNNAGATLVARDTPMADAFVKSGMNFVETLQSWKDKQKAKIVEATKVVGGNGQQASSKDK